MYRLITLLIFFVSFLSITASDPNSEEIDLKETSNETPGKYPYTPTFNRIKCYFDRDNVTICSDTSVMGEVFIKDSDSHVLFYGDSLLSPYYKINVESLSGQLYIYIIVGDTTYTGIICK